MLGRIALGFCGLWALAVGGSALGEAISPRKRCNPVPVPVPGMSADELREWAIRAENDAADLRVVVVRLEDENRRLREDKDE